MDASKMPYLHLGQATELLFRTERCSYRIASLVAHVWPAIRLGQIFFSYDHVGRPTSYLTWAFVTAEVDVELRKDPRKILSLDEWNEGLSLWIMDVVAPSGDVLTLLRRARAAPLARFSTFSGVRRDDRGGISRIVSGRARHVTTFQSA